MDHGGEASGRAGDALERVFELHGSKGSVDYTERERRYREREDDRIGRLASLAIGY